MALRNECPVCRRGSIDGAAWKASVPSNVRRWRDCRTTVWKCSSCGSLISLEKRDLAPFYSDYPFAKRSLSSFTRAVYSAYLARLRRHGIRKDSAILDYGCGSGTLVTYLREKGYPEVHGYDPYSPEFKDPSRLERQYDLVVFQDAIEHLEEPIGTLPVLAGLVKRDGLLCIGTPRAEGISPDRLPEHLHSLHQPFHLQIFSEAALVRSLREIGFSVEQVHRRHSCDTRVPFINWAFLRAYMKSRDGMLDAGFEPPGWRQLLRAPTLLFWGLLGYWLASQDEMVIIARRKT
ncbi:MAG: class I SAM-dependent methyltransferase [Oligoflexia bacterium]|nr:class I SAM-dependent methyltransferase [Oligoflexia bacterium]